MRTTIRNGQKNQAFHIWDKGKTVNAENKQSLIEFIISAGVRDDDIADQVPR